MISWCKRVSLIKLDDVLHFGYIFVRERKRERISMYVAIICLLLYIKRGSHMNIVLFYKSLIIKNMLSSFWHKVLSINLQSRKPGGVPIFLEGINFILYADFLFRVFNFLFDFKHVLGTICVLCCVLLFTAIALMQHLNWQCGCMPAMEHSMCLAVFATIWT